MISQITREIYVQPSFEVMAEDFNMIVRYLFLSLEFLTFCMTLFANFIFLAIRMLTPNQVNLVKIEPRKQMASIDTVESLSLLLMQY